MNQSHDKNGDVGISYVLLANEPIELARSRYPTVNKDKAYCVHQAVSDNRNPHIVPGSQINETQDKSHYRGLNNPCDTPTEMCESKNERTSYQRKCPFCFRVLEESSQAV